MSRRSLTAGDGRNSRRCHRRPFLGNEMKVVTQVVDGVQQKLSQRHQAGFAVDGGALPGVGGDKPERASRLTPGDGHEVEFLFEVVFLVAQGSG